MNENNGEDDYHLKDVFENVFMDDNTNEDSSFDSFVYSNESQVECSLLKLLNEIGATHYSFKKIMDWASDAYLSGYKFSPQCSTFQQQIKRIEKWLNLSSCQPYQKTIVLPPNNLK